MLKIIPRFRITQLLSFTFSTTSQTYRIEDIKNSHLVTVTDENNSLPYLQQMQTEDGNTGIILKIEQKSKAVIGFYHPLQKSDKINLKKKDVSKISNQIDPFKYLNRVLDINYDVVQKLEPEVHQKIACAPKQIADDLYTFQSLSPVLSVCESIYLGSFNNFTGSLGSRRTSTALDLMRAFTSSGQNYYGIYLNTNLKEQKAMKTAASMPNCLAFGRKENSQSLTSVGVYMLAMKALMAAKSMQKPGKHVLCIMDNFNDIMANEWTILQNLKLPIAPISILNQLYSSSKFNRNDSSLSAITISNRQDQDVIQEYTTLGNNSKHLRTLGKQIDFPLNIRKNNNKIMQCPQLETLRTYVNKYLREKSESELQWKLKFHKDEPWEHYFLLDAEWWIPALKTYAPTSFDDRDLFVWFINTNITNDYPAHWRIQCIDAYKKYKHFLAEPENLRIGMDEQQLESFIQIAKFERYFDIFKKDYLV